LQVQLPKDDSKPEWKLDGSVVMVPNLPLNLLVSMLRDRILQFTGSSVSVSRIRLSYMGKILTNLEDEDHLVFSVRDTSI
jgi:splicing factor 3A subunit 1